MPIRASERARYPANWRAVSLSIRERAGGQCECEGECGLHRDTPGPRRCEERNGEPAKWARGKIVLTVAHLDHTPENVDPANLKAMCQRCHLRYDAPHHAKNAAETRRAKAPQRPLLEMPVTTDPTPYTLGPWERVGAWSWVRCWQRPGDPGRPVAASVSTLPQCLDWEVLAHLPARTKRRYVSMGRGALDHARRLADDLLRAAWPGLTRPATDFEVTRGR